MGCPPTQVASLFRLPNEIIIAAAKHIQLCRELNALSRTCRLLHELLNTFLYTKSAFDDNYALLWAAKNGVMSTATMAIQHGANINARMYLDATSMTNAADGAINLDAVAEENELQGSTPLLLGIRGHHTDIVRLLLLQREIQVNKGNENIGTPLQLSIALGHTEILQLLLRRTDVDVNQAFEWPNPVYCSYFTMPPLTLAVSLQSTQSVQLLLECANVEVNKQTAGAGTALHVAVLLETHDLAVLLLSHPDIDINATYNFGFEWTIFDAAVCRPSGWALGKMLLRNPMFDRRLARRQITHALLDGEDEVAEFLLPCADSSTLLHIVERSCQMEAWRAEHFVSRLSQRQDIDVNATDSYYGWTSLHWAAYHGNVALVTILLQQGCATSRNRDWDGCTAAEVAMREGHDELVSILCGPA